MELYHHGRKGQHWGVTNGPPYPLDMNNKEYKQRSKLGQFMYDRFSEYGKDHQAVRDKYIANYRRKGYNETASQILAEQKYQRNDRALVAGTAVAASLLTGSMVGGLIYGKIIQAGGTAAIKTALGKAIAESMKDVISGIGINSISKDSAVALAKGITVK